MDYGLFGVRFLFLGIKREPLLHRLLIYFATAPFSFSYGKSVYTSFPQPRSSHIAFDSLLPLKGYLYYLAS